jgi:hypothetical protein
LWLRRPPNASYVSWTFEASLFALQGVLTMAFLRRGWTPPPTVARTLLTSTSIGVSALGAWPLAMVATGHFEGYAVVIGTALCVQGVLTLAELRRWTGFVRDRQAL